MSTETSDLTVTEVRIRAPRQKVGDVTPWWYTADYTHPKGQRFHIEAKFGGRMFEGCFKRFCETGSIENGSNPEDAR